MPSLIDELVVNGIRSSLSSSLAHALSGGLSGAIGNLTSQGLLSGLKFNSPALQNAVSQAKTQLPASATPPAPDTSIPTPSTDVSPLVVTGTPAAPPTPGGVLGQAIGSSVGPTPVATKDAPDTTPEVSGLTVSPKVENSGIPPAALLLPAGAAGIAALASSGGSSTPAVPAPTSEVSPVTVNGEPAPPTPGITPTEAAIGSGALGGGAVAAAEGGGGATPDLGAYPDTLAGAGGGLPFGLTPKDLIAGAIVGAGAIGGTGGNGGTNADALTSLAGNSANLADRLGNIASAGFAGDIGGKGLNSIARMVRHAQAAIRQRYASLGMSGSTAENQDLQAAADSGVDLQFKVGQEMATTGLNAIAALTGQSASIYTSLLNAQTAKDTALGNALANFAGSLVR